MQTVAEHLGPVEVLVNNAGVGSAADVAEMSEADWDAFFGVDLEGMWLCVKHVLPQMGRLGGGSIINISSIHAHLTRPGTFPYAAAKAGVLGLTRSLALDLAPQNIRVNAICPGFIRTAPIVKMLDSQPDPAAAWERLYAAQPMGRIGTPEEIAHVAAFLASPKAPSSPAPLGMSTAG
jgi:NAD(P)-dependent dehydrogenase (short-subunit alcohol dehydrogenase family)